MNFVAIVPATALDAAGDAATTVEEGQGLWHRSKLEAKYSGTNMSLAYFLEEERITLVEVHSCCDKGREKARREDRKREEGQRGDVQQGSEAKTEGPRNAFSYYSFRHDVFNFILGLRPASPSASGV